MTHRVGAPTRWTRPFTEWGVLRQLRGGAVLFRQGDPGDRAFLIVHGAVKLTAANRDGDDTLLGIRTGGDVVGIEAISMAANQQVTAVCMDDVDAWYLDRRRATRALAEEPGLYADIVRSLAQANDDLAARLADQVLRVDERLARLLVRQADQLGLVGRRGVVLPRLSQRELASAVGASRRAVERALRDLRRDGVVDLSYSAMIILNQEGLTRRAGGSVTAGPPPPIAAAALAEGPDDGSSSGQSTPQHSPTASFLRDSGATDDPTSAPAAQAGQPKQHSGATSYDHRTAGRSTEPDHIRGHPSPYVVFNGTRYDVTADEPFTFGRSRESTVCLGETDIGISRRAGSVSLASGVLWLTNTSAGRPLSVVDALGLRSVLAPGRRTAVEGRLRALIDGTNGSYELVLHGPEPPRVDTSATSLANEVLIGPADRLAMVALFAGYLEDSPRYDPHPKSYAAAAARLGWPRTTLVKRIEYLRTRLADAGVPNMYGWTALQTLAEYALARGLISRDDLQLLSRRPSDPASTAET